MFKRVFTGLAVKLGVLTFNENRARLLAKKRIKEKEAKLEKYRREIRATAHIRWGGTCQYGTGFITAGAHEKAIDLLMKYLDENQLAQLADTGSFLVRGNSGSLYEIRGHSAYSILPSYRGNAVRQDFFCVGPSLLRLPLPSADIALGHLIYLKADEDEWLHAANRSTGWYTTTPVAKYVH